MLTVIYLLKVLISSGILYAYYYFFLRNKAIHQYNRYCLLLAAAISLLLPFFSIEVFSSGTNTSDVLKKTLEVITVKDLGRPFRPLQAQAHQSSSPDRIFIVTTFYL
jgi:hypothetical protein